MYFGVYADSLVSDQPARIREVQFKSYVHCPLISQLSYRKADIVSLMSVYADAQADLILSSCPQLIGILFMLFCTYQYIVHVNRAVTIFFGH